MCTSTYKTIDINKKMDLLSLRVRNIINCFSKNQTLFFLKRMTHLGESDHEIEASSFLF